MPAGSREDNGVFVLFLLLYVDTAVEHVGTKTAYRHVTSSEHNDSKVNITTVHWKGAFR